MRSNGTENLSLNFFFLFSTKLNCYICIMIYFQYSDDAAACSGSNNCLQTSDSINYWHLMSLLFTTVMHISFYFHIQLEIEEVKQQQRKIKIIKMKIFLIFDFTFDMLLWLLLHTVVSDACCTFVTIARDQQVKQKFSYSLFFCTSCYCNDRMKLMK